MGRRDISCFPFDRRSEPGISLEPEVQVADAFIPCNFLCFVRLGILRKDNTALFAQTLEIGNKAQGLFSRPLLLGHPISELISKRAYRSEEHTSELQSLRHLV